MTTKTIYRLLENGEPFQEGDEYVYVDAKRTVHWVKRGLSDSPMTEDHNPTRRRETIQITDDYSVAGTPQRSLSRDEFAAAALTGLCSIQSDIEKTLKMATGGSSLTVYLATARAAFRFADAVMQAREEQL